MALSPNSVFKLSGTGILDLSSFPRQIGDGNSAYSASLKRLEITDNARLTVSSLAPVMIRERLDFDQGEIAAFLDSGVNSRAPIQINDGGTFVYGKNNKLGPANLYMVISDEDARQQQGSWNVIDGEVENADELARNTYLLIPALENELSSNDAIDFVEVNGVVSVSYTHLTLPTTPYV